MLIDEIVYTILGFLIGLIFIETVLRIRKRILNNGKKKNEK